jgi:eukaryotic-like serine/threonine-protein kinase
MRRSRSADPEGPELRGTYEVLRVVRSVGVLSIFEVRDLLGRKLWLVSTARGVTPDARTSERIARVTRELASITLDAPLHVVVSSEAELVVEAPQGPDLERLVADRRPDPATLARWLVALSLSVHELHGIGQKGLFLSPAVVFESQGRLRLALVEALLRRAQDGELLTRGPEEPFLAPELRRGAPPDVASDVFAIGAIGSALLGKRRPRERPVDDGASPLLARALERATDPTPTRRQESARALARDLADAVGLTDVRQPISLLPSEVDTRAPRIVREQTRALVALAAAMVGVAAIVSFVGGPAVPPPTKAGTPRGAVRVLADPWADVFVDGVRVDTTPFDRAIELPPGPHELTLRHPSAPDERRTVEVVAGATATVDVVMRIPSVRPPPVDETP